MTKKVEAHIAREILGNSAALKNLEHTGRLRHTTGGDNQPPGA
ncbi:hypothetical protein [Leisingera sp. JC1]|nr:hypothetical protein [Leisingera sp. JC1]